MTTLGQGFHGIRGATPDNLLLDAGVLYKNINVEALRAGGTGQFGNSISSATLLGATKGGGSWNSGRELREIEVNGKIFPLKNGKRINAYAPVLQVSLLEVTQANLVDALGPVDVDEWPAFNEIRPAIEIDGSDYISNIAWVGTISGKADPIIIVLENVLSSEPLSVPVEDKNEAVLAVTFMGHATMAAPHTPPFGIFYPASGEGGGEDPGPGPDPGGSVTVVGSTPPPDSPNYGGSDITLEFSGPLVEMNATNVVNYVLIRNPGGDNFNVPLNTPVYSAGPPVRVTLTPTSGFSSGSTYQLSFSNNGAGLGVSPYTLNFTYLAPGS